MRDFLDQWCALNHNSTSRPTAPKCQIYKSLELFTVAAVTPAWNGSVWLKRLILHKEQLTSFVSEVSEAVEDWPHSASTRGRGSNGVTLVAGLQYKNTFVINDASHWVQKKNVYQVLWNAENYLNQSLSLLRNGRSDVVVVVIVENVDGGGFVLPLPRAGQTGWGARLRRSRPGSLKTFTSGLHSSIGGLTNARK